MKRIIASATLLVVIGSAVSAGAADVHKSWTKFFKGDWTYDWQAKEGDFSERGEISYSLAAKGNVAIGRVTTENGDLELETWGWDSASKAMVLTGYSSNGSFWVVRYTDVTAEKMSGTGHGKLPDGRTWEGKQILTKTDDGFKVEAESVADGKQLITTGTITRNKPSDETGGIPPRALKELGYMVGKWKSENYVDDVRVGGGKHERKWVPGEYCLSFSWIGEEDGEKVVATGISGWDAKAQQMVEHWHSAAGEQVVVRYPLARMTAKEWAGTNSFTHSNGVVTSGRCKLTKVSDDEWIYVLETVQDGKKSVRKSVTKRVK